MPFIFIATLTLFAAAVQNARADIVDYFQFRTQHSEFAGKTAGFKIKIERSHRYDPGQHDIKEIRCKAHPTRPSGGFTCKGLSARFYNELDNANFLARYAYNTWGQPLRDARKIENDSYQFSLKNGFIYHVKIPAPFVEDDSMECQISIVAALNRGSIRCRSEFFPENKFEVKDVLVQYIRGSDFLWGYDENNLVKRDPKELAKVREVISGMNQLKKWGFAREKTDSFVGFRLDIAAWENRGHGSLIDLAYFIAPNSSEDRQWVIQKSADDLGLRLNVRKGVQYQRNAQILR